MMDLVNIDNHSKTLAFKKLKRLPYKCDPKSKLTKAWKLTKQSNKLEIREFLVLCYDCIPNIKHV